MPYTPVPINPIGPASMIEFIPDTEGAYFRFMAPSYPVAAIDQTFGSDGIIYAAFTLSADAYGLATMDTAAGAITRYDGGVAPGFAQSAQLWTDGVNFKGVFDGPDGAMWNIVLSYGALGGPISSVAYPLLISDNSTISVLGSKSDGGDGMRVLWRYVANATPDQNEMYVIEVTPTTVNMIGPVLTMTEADFDLQDNGFNLFRENGGFYYALPSGGFGGLYVLKIATDGTTAEQLVIEPTEPDLDMATFSFIGGSDNIFLAVGRDFDGETVLLEMTPAFDTYIRKNIYEYALPESAIIFADDTRLFSNFSQLGTFIPYAVPAVQAVTQNLKIGDGIKLPCYSPCTPVIIKEDYSL